MWMYMPLNFNLKLKLHSSMPVNSNFCTTSNLAYWPWHDCHPNFRICASGIVIRCQRLGLWFVAGGRAHDPADRDCRTAPQRWWRLSCSWYPSLRVLVRDSESAGRGQWLVPSTAWGRVRTHLNTPERPASPSRWSGNEFLITVSSRHGWRPLLTAADCLFCAAQPDSFGWSVWFMSVVADLRLPITCTR